MRISRFEFSQLRDFRPQPESFVLDEVIEDMRKEEVVVPVKPTFSEEQLAKAKEEANKAGHKEGFEAATAKANEEGSQRERDMLLLLEKLETQLKKQQGSYDQVIADESRDLGRFILATARKIAGDALTLKPEVAVQELLGQCLPILLQKPRVTIEVNSKMVEFLDARIKPFLARAGFEGEVQFRANDQMTASDAIVEWAGGRAIRDNESMWQEIERMINQLSFAPTTHT